jgi:hypothetical protein
VSLFKMDHSRTQKGPPIWNRAPSKRRKLDWADN